MLRKFFQTACGRIPPALPGVASIASSAAANTKAALRAPTAIVSTTHEQLHAKIKLMKATCIQNCAENILSQEEVRRRRQQQQQQCAAKKMKRLMAVLAAANTPAPCRGANTAGGMFKATPARLDINMRRTAFRQKWFGNIMHGPRNYPHRFSRQYARRHTMKKKKIIKRWKFKRYKLAALANMPVSHKIRVRLIPALGGGSTASVSTGKGDIDAGTEQLDAIAAAFDGKGGGSGKGAKKLTRRQQAMAKSRYI